MESYDSLMVVLARVLMLCARQSALHMSMPPLRIF